MLENFYFVGFCEQFIEWSSPLILLDIFVSISWIYLPGYLFYWSNNMGFVLSLWWRALTCVTPQKL